MQIVTHDEACKRFIPTLIVVNRTNGTTSACTRGLVIEPERRVHVEVSDRHREDSDRGAIVGRPEVRVKAIDGDVRVVCGNAWIGEGRLGRRVVASSDCKQRCDKYLAHAFV